MIFSVIGTYASTNNIYEVWIMLGFGVGGFYLTKLNFVPAGILLGIILGPIAENGLRDLLTVSQGSPISFVLTRPISVALIICIILAIYFSLRPKKWD